MVTDELKLEVARLDFAHVVAGIDEIRRYNPQRFEFEQLTAIILDDPQRSICVGYRDLSCEEFWVRGHLPGNPIFPGVLMCEAAAQCCSYFIQKHDLLGTRTVGFGGMDQIKFRRSVVPGDRLVIAVQLLRQRRGSMVSFRFQEYVQELLVCEGTIKGVPLEGQVSSA